MKRRTRSLIAILLALSLFACATENVVEVDETTTTEPDGSTSTTGPTATTEAPTTTTQPEGTFSWAFSDPEDDVVDGQGEPLDDGYADLTEIEAYIEHLFSGEAGAFVFRGHTALQKDEDSFSRAFQLQLGEVVGTSFLASTVFNWQTHNGVISSNARTAATGAPLNVYFDFHHAPDYLEFEFRIPTSALPVDFNAFALVVNHMAESGSPRSQDIAGPFNLGGIWDGSNWTNR